MEIHGNKEKFNYDASLQPLFDAMAAGKTITSLVCMLGTNNKDDRSKDCEIQNFVATSYWIGMSSNGGIDNDYVYIDHEGREDFQRPGFYMNWVLSYEIDRTIIYNAQHTNPKNYNCAAIGNLDQCHYPNCVCHNNQNN